jgi:protein arginine kinase
MTFEDFAGLPVSWLDASGDASTIVVSSRVRLARNLTGLPFPNRANESHKNKLVSTVLAARSKNEKTRDLAFFEAEDLNSLQQQVLVERHVLSPAMITCEGSRGVLVGQAGRLSVMLNEEDHFRFQAILSGLQPQNAWQQVSELQSAFAESLHFAIHEVWGYLTACPSNTGTGLRASVLIHLPGLVLTQEMDAVVRGITQMGFAVRGLFGEGTDALGNMFQVSNQITLGRSEQALLDMLMQAVTQLVACEENAREVLFGSARSKIEDKVWRAWGILKHARLLTSQEFMNLVSAVRLGISLELIHHVSLHTLNKLMVQTQPSHLQFLIGRQLEATERDIFRADWVRRELMPS